MRRRISRRSAAAFAVIMAALPFLSRITLASTVPQAQYTRSLWRVQDGLPEDTVQALAETRDGYLWIGTTGGLTRFDGTHFVLYGSAAPQAAVVNSIFCLTPSSDGSLWVGTEGGGLIRIVHGTETSYGAANGLTDGFVRSVLEARDGVIWVGTDNGLFQIAGDRATRVEMPADVGSLAVHSIAQDREGRIWVGGSRLLSIQDGRMQFYNLPGTYSSNRVKTILETGDGTLWVGTVGGLARRVKDQFEAVSQFRETVRTLKQTSDGTLWIGTIGHGLWTYKDGSFAHLGKLLPGNTVLKIFEDDVHQVWIGLQDGLVRLSRTPVQVIPLPNGSDADFETLSGDSGGVWVVASGVYRVKDGVSRPYRFKELPPLMVRTIFRDRGNDLWIGTDGSGAYHLTSHGPLHYAAYRDLPNNFIRAFLETRRGDVWIGTDEGVSRISPGGIRTLTVQDGLAYSSTRSLLEDHHGDVWIGTDQGLSHWHGGAFHQDDVTRALAREKVWSIFQGATDTLWFGTRDHGLFRYENGQMAQYTTTQGLASNSIYQILQDLQGRFWFSGPNAISSVDEQQLHQDPGNQHLSVSVYAMPYGAEGAQMYGGRQPSGYLDSGGGLWFPTSKGVAHIIPWDIAIPDPPRVVVNEVTLDGRVLPVEGTIQLPSHITRLEFGYSALSLQPQDGIRFQYKLDGFDKDWVYADRHQTASYTNLPPGTYRFRVQAFDVANPVVIGEAGAVIRRSPFFWQTWWFATVCIAALLLLGWTIFQIRLHQVRLRFRAVLEERGRLAREMHDTVIQGCTSISALLEAVASLPSKNREGIEEDLLTHARTQVRATIDEARHAVWNLRHEEGPTIDLLTSIDTIVKQVRKEFGIQVSCVTEDIPVILPNATCRELLQVMREAVHNAALHGSPKVIEIAIRYEAQQLGITVTDDGVGFRIEAGPAEGHFGITGMRERMQRLGGEFLLSSTPGSGTRVQFILRRNQLSAQASGARHWALP